MFWAQKSKSRKNGTLLSGSAASEVNEASSVWSDSLGKTASRLLQALIIIGFGVLAFLALAQVSTVAIPLLLAVILASTFYPIMRWLRSKGVPSLLATLIVLFGVVAVLSSVTWMIVNSVINQWDELSARANDGFNQVVSFVESLPFNLDLNTEMLEKYRDIALGFLTSSQFGSGALAVGSAVGNFATGFVLLVVILFFFLKDGPQIWAFVCRPFTGQRYQRALRIGDSTVKTFGSYVRGTATVAAVDAIGIGVGLLVIGVPLALPLAVLVFILSFIPIVGATLAGVLAALVALVSNGLWSAVAVIAIVVIVNQLEGNLLQPVLMGRALKLHSLVILLALTVGTVTAGILGAILSVPLVAAVWGAIKVWDGEDKPAKWARPKTADLS